MNFLQICKDTSVLVRSSETENTAICVRVFITDKEPRELTHHRDILSMLYCDVTEKNKLHKEDQTLQSFTVLLLWKSIASSHLLLSHHRKGYL